MEHEKVTILDNRKDRADGLEDKSCWTAQPIDRFTFRAGSYSGYNAWRESLCLMAFDVRPEAVWRNPEHYHGQPFFELIDFSDCEGTIGAKTSAKLNEDFLNHMQVARNVANTQDDSWFYEKFLEWEKAFAMAADGGFVRFH